MLTTKTMQEQKIDKIFTRNFAIFYIVVYVQTAIEKLQGLDKKHINYSTLSITI